jgi:O-antigen/teichoic acid export membrane protein
VRLKRILALGSIVSASPMIEYASRLGRTIILSHMLSPTEFGISIALTILLATAGLVTDISLDKFLMSSGGDDVRKTLGAVHFLTVLRGLVLAGAIFIAAPWIADFFGAPGSIWAFRSIGVISAISAFAHFGIKQALRDFSYGRDAVANVAAQVTAFAAIYPAVRGFGDHRAIVLSLLVEAIVYVAASHLLARVRYSATSAERHILGQALAFGLPLTLNGLGLAMLSQFDRGLVSHWLGLSSLALYAVILNLAVVPISLIFRVVGQLWLSFLTRARHRGNVDTKVYPVMVWSFALVASTYALFTAMTLDLLVPLIFGRIYTVSPLIHMLVTMMVWFRVQRGGAPSLLMLSDGRTSRLTIGNLTAGTGIALALVGLYFVPRLETMFVCVVIGEAISTIVMFWISQTTRTQSRILYSHVLWSLSATVVAAIGDFVLVPSNLTGRIIVFVVASIIILAHATYGIRKYSSYMTAWFGFRFSEGS